MDGLVAAEGGCIEIARLTRIVRHVESETPVQTEHDEAQVVAKADTGVHGEVVAQPLKGELSPIQGS